MLRGGVRRSVPTLGRLDNGGALFYSRCMNLVFGDSGIGKSWLLVVAIAQLLLAGKAVMVIDYEGSLPELLHRLRLLGVTAGALEEHLIYIQPDDAATPVVVDRLADLVRERGVELVVIDSLGEAFAVEEIDEDDDRQVGPWLRRIRRKLTSAGAAVVLIDHAPKNSKSPLHPSGSKRKRAAVTGAAYAVTTASTGGRVDIWITCAKDRHGTYRTAKKVARFTLTPTDSGSVTAALTALTGGDAMSSAPGGESIEDIALEAVEAVRRLENAGERPTKGAVKEQMGRRRAAENQRGLDHAIRQGGIEVVPGDRGAQVCRLPADAAVPAVPTHSEPFPEQPSSPSRPVPAVPTPKGGNRERERVTDSVINSKEYL